MPTNIAGSCLRGVLLKLVGKLPTRAPSILIGNYTEFLGNLVVVLVRFSEKVTSLNCTELSRKSTKVRTELWGVSESSGR